MVSYYRRRMTRGEAAGAAVVAILAIGAAQSGTGTRHPEAAAAGIPITIAAGEMTPESWARAVLEAEHLPQTACNLGALEAWEAAEGGAWQNSAAYNPLNSTMPEPGSSVINSDGVRAYVSWRQGLEATVATLNNGRYGAILSSLRSGRNAQAVADAVAASPWGTERFGASC